MIVPSVFHPRRRALRDEPGGGLVNKQYGIARLCEGVLDSTHCGRLACAWTTRDDYLGDLFFAGCAIQQIVDQDAQNVRQPLYDLQSGFGFAGLPLGDRFIGYTDHGPQAELETACFLCAAGKADRRIHSLSCFLPRYHLSIPFAVGQSSFIEYR